MNGIQKYRAAGAVLATLVTLGAGVGVAATRVYPPDSTLAQAQAPQPEPMSGPDAWETLGMGGHGLKAAARTNAERARSLELARARLEEDLGLNADQRAKLADNRRAYRRAAIDRDAKLEIARLDLEDAMHASHPDTKLIDQIIVAIDRLRADALEAHVQLMMDQRALLTPGQWRTLQDMRSGSGYGRK